MFDSGFEGGAQSPAGSGGAGSDAAGPRAAVRGGLFQIDAGVSRLLSEPLAGLPDTECREAVREVYAAGQRLQAAWLRLVRELDRRPNAVAGARAGRVAQTFLRQALHRGGAAARDVAAAHACGADAEVPGSNGAASDAGAGNSAAGVGGAPDAGDTPDEPPEQAGDDGSGATAQDTTTGAEGAAWAVPGVTRWWAGERAPVRLPQMGQALAAGAVSREHVDVAVRALRRIPTRLLEQTGDDGIRGADRIDEFIADVSTRFDPWTTDALARHLLAVLDPDRSEGFDPLAYERRELAVSRDSAGMTLLRGQLDPAGGELFRVLLDHFSAPVPAITGDSKRDMSTAREN